MAIDMGSLCETWVWCYPVDSFYYGIRNVTATTFDRFRHSSFTFFLLVDFFLYCLSLFMFNISLILFTNVLMFLFSLCCFCASVCIHFNSNMRIEINSHGVDGSVVWNKCFSVVQQKCLPCNFSYMCVCVNLIT